MPDSSAPSDLGSDARDTAWIKAELDTDIQFPPLPRTVAEVTHLVTEDETEPDPRKLAELVDSDPVIAATVLQRINSAYYGMRRRITSVRKAVMLLGFLDVANVVLTAGMMQLEEIFAATDQQQLFNHIMQLSVGTGQFARELAQGLELSIEGPAYSAGLLHSTGRLIFLYGATDDYTALSHTDDERALPTVDAETFIFGISHPEIGAQAASMWKLPDVLTEAILHYTKPEQAEASSHRQVAALVGAAVAAQTASMSTQSEIDLAEAPAVQSLASIADTAASTLADLIAERSSRVQDYVSMIMGS